MNDQTTVQSDNDIPPAGAEHQQQHQDQQHDAPPVEPAHHEARKYRKRAQAAEQELQDARRDLEAKASRLAELEQTVAALERRNRIDELLREAKAVDLEAARLLTEAAVAQMDEPDLAAAVDELRRAKPFLFGRPASADPARNGVMSPRPGEQPRQRTLSTAAADALSTGDRADLLRYLRLKRQRR